MLRRTELEKEAKELGVTYAREGERGMLHWFIERELANAENAGSGSEGPANRAWNMALWYARLGQPEGALEWLEKAVGQRRGFVIFTKVHPWLDSIRSDPRYDAILKKMNLDD